MGIGEKQNILCSVRLWNSISFLPSSNRYSFSAFQNQETMEVHMVFVYPSESEVSCVEAYPWCSPVKQKLKSRIASVEDKWPRCNDVVESIKHCFLYCQQSLQSWTRARFSTQNWTDRNSSFWQWWLDRVKEVKTENNGAETLSKIAFVLWHLWLAQNDKVFEDKNVEPQDIASITLSLSDEFLRLKFSISLSS